MTSLHSITEFQKQRTEKAKYINRDIDAMTNPKTIKFIRCACGEDVFEDDRPEEHLDTLVQCINCGETYKMDELVEVEVADVIKERLERD